MLGLIYDAIETLWYPDGERRWVRRVVTVGVLLALLATVMIIATQMAG